MNVDFKLTSIKTFLNSWELSCFFSLRILRFDLLDFQIRGRQLDIDGYQFANEVELLLRKRSAPVGRDQVSLFVRNDRLNRKKK